MTKSIKFDRKFQDRVAAVASKMTVREIEYMSSVGLRKEFAGKYDEAAILAMEDIYWFVAAGKRAAEKSGVALKL